MKVKTMVLLIAAVLSVTALAGCTDTALNTQSGSETSSAASAEASAHQEDEEKSCCHSKETSDDDTHDCCKNKESEANTESFESSDIPDCCGGE